MLRSKKNGLSLFIAIVKLQNELLKKVSRKKATAMEVGMVFSRCESHTHHYSPDG